MRITIGLAIEDGKGPPWVTKGEMLVAPEHLVPALQEMVNEFLRAFTYYNAKDTDEQHQRDTDLSRDRAGG